MAFHAHFPIIGLASPTVSHLWYTPTASSPRPGHITVYNTTTTTRKPNSCSPTLNKLRKRRRTHTDGIPELLSNISSHSAFDPTSSISESSINTPARPVREGLSTCRVYSPGNTWLDDPALNLPAPVTPLRLVDDSTPTKFPAPDVYYCSACASPLRNGTPMKPGTVTNESPPRRARQSSASPQSDSYETPVRSRKPAAPLADVSLPGVELLSAHSPTEKRKRNVKDPLLVPEGTPTRPTHGPRLRRSNGNDDLRTMFQQDLSKHSLPATEFPMSFEYQVTLAVLAEMERAPKLMKPLEARNAKLNAPKPSHGRVLFDTLNSLVLSLGSPTVRMF